MLRVLYEDHHLIAVDKPAPLLTQAPPGIANLESLVKDYIREKYSKPAGVYLGVPHRLDRPVTGVVIFARNTKAAQRVHQQFHDRTVRKTYRALVEGAVAPPEGEWRDWMMKVPGESRAVQAETGQQGAKEAVLRYRVLDRAGSFTRLELQPLTGRMHQLRAQCAWHGHPVKGDRQYGATAPDSTDDRERVIALHAYSLDLMHPFTKMPLHIEAACPW